MKKIFLLMLILLISISFVFADVDGTGDDTNTGNDDSGPDDDNDDLNHDEPPKDNSEQDKENEQPKEDDLEDTNEEESNTDGLNEEESNTNGNDYQENTNLDNGQEHTETGENDNKEDENNYQEENNQNQDDNKIAHCPSDEELDQMKVQCEAEGHDYRIDFNDGCDYVLCMYEDGSASEEEYYYDNEDNYVDDKDNYNDDNYQEHDNYQNHDDYCPSDDDIKEKIAGCENDGFEYELKEEHGCEIVMCHGPEFGFKDNHHNKNVEKYGDAWCRDGNCCPDNICDDFEQRTHRCDMDCHWDKQDICITEQEFQKKSDECIARGMVPVAKGEDNCRWMACNFNYGDEPFKHEEGMMCPTQEDLTKHKEDCEQMGLTAYTDVEHGCAVVYCDGGYEGLEYKDDWKIPSSVEMLSFVLKIEGIKIKLDSVEEKISGISKYYETSEDSEKAKNYVAALNEIEKVQQDLDSVIEKIKTIASEEEMDYNQFIEVKHNIKDVVDNGIHNILSDILGI